MSNIISIEERKEDIRLRDPYIGFSKSLKIEKKKISIPRENISVGYH